MDEHSAEAMRVLWEFVAYGTCLGWIMHMIGFGTSGKRLTSVLSAGGVN